MNVRAVIGVSRVLVTRAIQAATVALMVGVIAFLLVQALPGDIAMRIAAGRYGMDLVSGTAADLVRQELGLDRPWMGQLLDWLWALVRLDLGVSLVTGERVIDELHVQLGHTLLLSLAALFLSLLIGPPLGLLLGLRAGSAADRAGLAVAAAIRALPPFVLGLLLVLLFALTLGWLPPAGFEGARELVLPALTLALGLAATSSRVTRDATAAVVAAPYFAFARWKGLSDRQALLRHGLRNAAVPVIAYLGMQLVWLIEGVVVVESLFAWPGIGHALVHAIFSRDIPMVQGTALVMGLIFVVLNAVVDLLCVLVDPRRRVS